MIPLSNPADHEQPFRQLQAMKALLPSGRSHRCPGDESGQKATEAEQRRAFLHSRFRTGRAHPPGLDERKRRRTSPTRRMPHQGRSTGRVGCPRRAPSGPSRTERRPGDVYRQRLTALLTARLTRSRLEKAMRDVLTDERRSAQRKKSRGVGEDQPAYGYAATAKAHTSSSATTSRRAAMAKILG